MLYRPNFCCNCGEKIERVEWNLLTSRRFCDLCASEMKLADLVPRIILAVAVLVGMFGVGSYIGSVSSLAEQPPQKRSLKSVGRERGPVAANIQATDLNARKSQESHPGQAVPERKNLEGAPRPQQSSLPAQQQTVYFCGAMTKKGTPCSRKVKGPVRCWQHAGQPKM